MLIVRVPALTAFYYLLRGTYAFEQQGVLAGRLGYLKARDCDSGVPIYLLTRNIHRIEKGLSMRSKRATFAEGYIAQTMDALERIVSNQQGGCASIDFGETLLWACDVLREYFRVVDGTNVIRAQKERFFRVLDTMDCSQGQRIPYARGVIESAPVTYDSLRQLAIQRRSVRFYQRRQVPRKDIDRALQIAALSPSACNRQAFEFRVYDDPGLIRAICALCVGVRGIEDGIPCLVVVVGKYRAYSSERDRHLIYIDASLAVMAVQFALETLNLASTCLNWPCTRSREKAMRRLLHLEDDERIVVLLAIGYADPEGLIPYSQKKPLARLRSYNKL